MSDAPGLIIDVRGNDGGAFPVRKEIAQKLLPERKLFWACKGRSGDEHVFLDPADRVGGHLVVLVDVLSRSSTEEFAGNLRAIGRATVERATPRHLGICRRGMRKYSMHHRICSRSAWEYGLRM